MDKEITTRIPIVLKHNISEDGWVLEFKILLSYKLYIIFLGLLARGHISLSGFDIYNGA